MLHKLKQGFQAVKTYLGNKAEVLAVGAGLVVANSPAHAEIVTTAITAAVTDAAAAGAAVGAAVIVMVVGIKVFKWLRMAL